MSGSLRNDFGDNGARVPYVSAYDHHAAKNGEMDHDFENCIDCKRERGQDDEARVFPNDQDEQC